MIVDICCNNPDNGLFDGKATAIKMGAYHFEAKNMNGHKLTDMGDSLRIHGKRYPYKDYREWVGNWCWNSYNIPRADALKLWDVLMNNGFWEVERG